MIEICCVCNLPITFGEVWNDGTKLYHEICMNEKKSIKELLKIHLEEYNKNRNYANELIDRYTLSKTYQDKALIIVMAKRLLKYLEKNEVKQR